MRKKKMWIGISSILGIFIVICLVIAFSVKANLLNYNDIAFTYGKEGDVVYYKFVSEDGLDINLNSIVTKNQRDSDGKVVASKMYIWVGAQPNPTSGKTTSYSRETLSNEEATVEWVFIFRDKTITVLNGKLQNN